MARIINVAFLVLLLCPSAAASKVTPVEKVIELLGRLQAKVEEEGKAEAAAYDKYSCFCKEQADEKQYNIEKSTKEIAEMDAKINDIDAEITGLNTDITDLVSDIATLKSEINVLETNRSRDHDAYLVQDGNVTGAIAAVEGAIEALKNSKGDLKGKVDKDSLLQMVSAAALLSTVTDAQLEAVQALAPGGGGDASGYKYKSNDIIETLKSLRTQFIQRKNELDQEEFDANAIFEKSRLGKQNEKQFKEQDNSEKQEQAAALSEEVHEVESDRSDENDAKTGDQAFMAELTTDCEAKAATFDQRSKTRSAELTACQSAMDELKKGVAENYDANKKLVGLQVSKKAAGQWVWKDDAARPASFLQLRGNSRVSSGAVAVQKLVALLSESASRLDSAVLAMAAMKAQNQEDHFVKVRQMIKDLVARLKEDKRNEASEKSFCDTNMAAQTAKRDAANAQLESIAGSISSTNALITKTNGEIADLSQGIADNKKAVAEAQELRDAEKDENDQTLADANAGKTAVDNAISILNTFYNNAALLQYTPESERRTNADRSGKTVADLAPGTESEDYKGGQTESKGIIGLLEVIQSDYQRTIDQVTSDESAAVIAFNTFKSTTDIDTTGKDTSKTTKEGIVSTKEDLLVDTLEVNKAFQTTKRDDALDELTVLHERCVKASETYEQRVAKRQQEIESLKEASQILDDWQK